MKKTLLFITVLTTIGLSACSPGQKTTDSPTLETTTQVSNEVKEEAMVAVKNEAEKKDTVPFEEMTAVDNDKCAIKVTGIEPDNIMGYTLKVTLENKSPDKTYMFSVTDAAVNGVQSDPFFATEVAPGKKANSDISFSSSALKKIGVTDFSDIEIMFHVYDSDDITADAAAEETVHVYPHGKDKAVMFTRMPKDSDNTIIDNDYATVTVTGYSKDDAMGYTVNLFLVNKTDKEAMFSVDKASVNGYMSDPFFAFSVMPNKCAFTSMSWGTSSLEENGIKEVKNIEFNLKIYDSDDFTTKPYVDKMITLTP